MDIRIYYAPVPGGHKPSDANAIYVRRPTEYNQGRGSAHAIRVEAYANQGPNETYYHEGQPIIGEMSAPIFVELMWVSKDHRDQWDARTKGRCGNIGFPPEYVSGTDVVKLAELIQRAINAIITFHIKS